MTITSWRDLLGPWVISFGGTLAGVRLLAAWTGSVPNVPIAAVFSVWALAIALVVTALSVGPRLRPSPGRGPMDALRAGRVVAIAMASSRTGAVVAGFFLGWLVAGLLADALSSPYARERALHAVLCCLGGVVILITGAVLERLCIVRPPRDDDA